MRHLWSLLAGVVVAPLAWLLLATGQHRSSRTVAAWDESGSFDTVDLIGPAAVLAVAGILLGLLGTLRWSPAGPLVAGLLYVIPTIFMFINPFRTLDAFSFGDQQRLFGQDLQPWLPVENGTLLVLGALLLMAVFSAHRWRRWPVTAGPLPAAVEHPVSGEPAAVPPGPMSDEEILAAAAAMEEEERVAATAERPAGSPEATEPPEPAPEEPAPEPPPEREPEPDTEPHTRPSSTSGAS